MQQQSTDRIKELKEEKLQIEALHVFLGDSPRITRDIDQEIMFEEDSQKRFPELLREAAKKECEYLRKMLPPALPTPPLKSPPPRAPVGTTAALEMNGQPVSATPYAPWTVVAPGQIEQHAAGYAGAYTWSTVPYHIGPEGFDLTLTAQAQCAQGQRLATGINLRGGFDFVKLAYDNTNVSTDLAVECNSNADRKSLVVHVKPSKTYGAEQDVVITIGAFYGPGVTYHYKPVRTGN